jgi:hypothetical protein
MKHILPLVASLLITLSFMTGQAQSVHNITKKTDYITIQEAIDSATAGDTVVVDAGNYNESLLVDKSLTLQGAQAGIPARALVNGLPTGSIRSGSETVIDSIHCLVVRASNVSIDGFTFLNYEEGINVQDLAGDAMAIRQISIINNILSSNKPGAEVYGVLMGEISGGSGNADFSNILIENNSISNSNVVFLGSDVLYDSIRITKNDLSNRDAYYGIYGDGVVASSLIAHSLIDSNWVHNSAAGIYCGYFSHTAILKNLFEDMLSNSLAVCLDSGMISENISRRCGTFAIGIFGSGDTNRVSRYIQVYNNDITYNDLNANPSNLTAGFMIGSGIEPPTIQIHYNSVLEGSGGSRSSGNWAMFNYSEDPGTLDATCNWYGNYLFSEVNPKFFGPAQYTPYLTNGADSSSDIGFQPYGDACNGPASHVTFTSTDLSEQYSDSVPVSANLTDDEYTALSGKEVTFYIGYLDSLGDWRFTPDSATATTDSLGNVVTFIKLTQDPDPDDTFWDNNGKAVLRVVFAGDSIYGSSQQDTSFNVRKENAILSITQMPLFLPTPDATANVTVTVNVQDINDGWRGDIQHARIKFMFTPKGDGTPIIAYSNVTLISPSDSTMGTAQVTVTLSSGSFGADPYTVHIFAGDYYRARINSALTIHRLRQSNLISGGGYFFLNGSTGSYAGDEGSDAHFGFSAKDNKIASKVQGHAVLIYRRNGRILQVIGNAQTQVSINYPGGVATYSAKATLRDITTDGEDSTGGPYLSGLTLVYSVTDNGEPGVNDLIAMRLLNGSTLLFANKGGGTVTDKQLLAGGNIQVRAAAVPCTADSLNVTNITGTSAVLNWTGTSGAVYKLEYKWVNAKKWTAVNYVSSPYTLSGLTAGRTYQWRITAACTTGSSTLVTGPSFTTLSPRPLYEIPFEAPVVFPNPTQGVFSLIMTGNEQGTAVVNILDANGRRVYQKAYTVPAGSMNVSVDISHLPAGLYMVQLIQSGKTTVTRIVKN